MSAILVAWIGGSLFGVLLYQDIKVAILVPVISEALAAALYFSGAP